VGTRLVENTCCAESPDAILERRNVHHHSVGATDASNPIGT
jgi:hypothetical protein